MTWTRLDQTAEAGSTKIVLQQPVDWEAGESIVITTTGHKDAREETEVHVIKGDVKIYFT